MMMEETTIFEPRSVQIQDMISSLYLLQFFHHLDLQRVLMKI